GSPVATRQASRSALGSGGRAGNGVEAGQFTRSADVEIPRQRIPHPAVRPLSVRRVCGSLDRLDIRYLADADGSLLAMWERHAVLFSVEGPEDEILVMRGRPHSTVAADWADRAYRAVNEWNLTRRFCKAYIGDPTELGM